MPRRQRRTKNSPPGATSAPRFGSGKKRAAKRGRAAGAAGEPGEDPTKDPVDGLAEDPVEESAFASALRRLTNDYASFPEQFFTSSAENSERLLAITKELYLHIKSQEASLGHEFSTLPELYTEGLDLEQVWEELQLQNRPTLKYLKGTFDRLNDMDIDAEEQGEEQSYTDDSDDGDDSDDDIQFAGRLGSPSDDLNDSTATEKMVFDNEGEHVDSDDVNSESEAKEDQDLGGSEDEVDDVGADDDDQELARDGSGVNLNDPDAFFNWDDYEAFADGKEGIDHLMNVVVDEYDQLQEIHEDDDSDKSKRPNEENEDVVEYGIDEEEADPSIDYSKLSYKDFFDPVAILRKKKQMQEDQAKTKSGSLRESMEASRDVEHDDAHGDESESHSESNSGSESASSSGSESDPEEPLSKHEQFQRAMKAQIRELEAENTKSRGWALNGEVRAQMRPQDSLMDADLEYTRSTKTAPVITPEVTATLEDLIKQRIKDELWDDVERKRPTGGAGSKTKALADVSTEKSKVGLGQIYAQEFEQRFLGAAAPGEEEARKKEEEILVLWKKLNYQLDALSNFHYTPKPKVKEMEVRTNVSAIHMEEVIPMGVSQASAAAPEEVQQKQKGRKGVLIGTEELTAEERQRARRASKAARRKRRRAKMVDERAIARANPGMGNKYERKKAMEELSRARNVTRAANDDANVRWTKSADVFSKLQADVRSGIDALAGSNGRDGHHKRRKKSAGSIGFKL